MLKEIENVRQSEDEPRRRWFSDTALDTYVWYDDDDNIIQFQVCYDKGPNERALTWHFERGLTHHTIDDGENRTFHMKSTPILVTDEKFNSGKIVDMFEELAEEMEYKLVRFIIEHIK